MYERFYQLRERPFALSPDPEYLYPSRVHQEALDYLRYGLESQAGFIVVTGEIGSGKTTLLQTLLRNLDNQTTVGRIVNTMLEPRELLETIMIDFGLDPSGRSKPLILRDLSQFLVDQRMSGRLVLLVIDEAQNLGLGALEELRMLSNLETEKSKLLQIVLVGQPNLRDKLAAPELEQLRQRITVSYHLPPLDADETGRYINHRLRRAAIGAPVEFPRDATTMIHGRSRGVPRLINVICDAALVFGYAEDRRIFDGPMIREVLSELESTGVLPAPPGVAPARTESPASTGQRTSTVAHAPETAQASAPASFAGAATLAEDPESGVRTIALDQREHSLRQRELELAEQRRVLAEEYRLLRAQQQQAASTASAPPPVVVPSGGHVRLQVPAGVSATSYNSMGGERFDAVRDEGFWSRLKRLMLGVSASS